MAQPAQWLQLERRRHLVKGHRAVVLQEHLERSVFNRRAGADTEQTVLASFRRQAERSTIWRPKWNLEITFEQDDLADGLIEPELGNQVREAP